MPRDKQVRKNLQLLRVKEYFYGSIRNTLTPFSQVVSFSEIVVRRIEEGSLVPSSALPMYIFLNSVDKKERFQRLNL